MRMSVAFIALLFLSGAAGAAGPDPRITQAIAAYDAQLDAEQQQKADNAAAVRLQQLTQDPATPFFGNPKADVTVIVFTDYDCAYCKASEPRLMKTLAEDKNLKIVMKEFPILGPDSVVAAKAALAALKQDKYAAYHEAMMASRGKLTTEQVFSTAQKVGLDMNRLRKDMESAEVSNQLLDNFILARALKLVVTPAYIVDSHVLSGLTPKTSTGKIDFAEEVAAVRARKK